MSIGPGRSYWPRPESKYGVPRAFLRGVVSGARGAVPPSTAGHRPAGGRPNRGWSASRRPCRRLPRSVVPSILRSLGRGWFVVRRRRPAIPLCGARPADRAQDAPKRWGLRPGPNAPDHRSSAVPPLAGRRPPRPTGPKVPGRRRRPAISCSEAAGAGLRAPGQPPPRPPHQLIISRLGGQGDPPTRIFFLVGGSPGGGPEKLTPQPRLGENVRDIPPV